MHLKKNNILLLILLLGQSLLWAQEMDFYAQKAFWTFEKQDYPLAKTYADSSQVKGLELWILQGESCLQTEDYKKAIQYFQQANQLQKNIASYELALCYAQNQKIDSAEYWLKAHLESPYKKRSNLIEFEPLLEPVRKSENWKKIWTVDKYYSETERSLERAIYYHQNKELDLSLDILDKLIRDNKTNSEFYFYRAKYILDLNQDYKYAIGDLKKAVKYTPENTDYLSFLGDCYAHEGKYKKSKDFYTKAYQIAPQKVSLLHKIAHSAFRSGAFEEAQKDIDQYLKISTGEVDAFKLAGLISYETEQYEKSIEYLYQALALDPRRADLLVARGKAHIEAENYTLAELDFGIATDLDARNGEFWYYKGLACLYQDKKAKACECFKKANYLNYYQAGEYLLTECQ